eukprot:SAG11_NODE_2581_length_3197_cov_3.875403_3_plen_98_part_00
MSDGLPPAGAEYNEGLAEEGFFGQERDGEAALTMFKVTGDRNVPSGRYSLAALLRDGVEVEGHGGAQVARLAEGRVHLNQNTVRSDLFCQDSLPEPP